MEIHWTYTENGEQQICKESIEMDITRKEETRKTKRNMEKECGSRDEGRRCHLVVDGERTAHNRTRWRALVEALCVPEHEED